MDAKKSRRGAPRRGDPSAHERLVETAIELFYQDGIRAIGIDKVLEVSRVSKSSLYRTFASKDALIAAVAEEQDRRFWAWWDHQVQTCEGLPRAQIEALVEGVAALIGSPQFRGCPFINLAAEFPDRQHPGTAIACKNKQEVRHRLHGLALAMGARDPVKLGNQLALLMDGAYGQSVTLDAEDVKRELIEAAQVLLDAHMTG